MNNIHLSKSGYCQCVQCEKIFWLNRYEPDCASPDNNESVFETGKKCGSLQKDYPQLISY